MRSIGGRINTSKRAGLAEWAHALAGGLSVRGAEGSNGCKPFVPEAVDTLKAYGFIPSSMIVLSLFRIAQTIVMTVPSDVGVL